MSSLSVALPLSLDASDGFQMIKGLKALVRQNLKMLVLTNPGERVMEPDLGVGLQTFLFSNFNAGAQSAIDARIREQCQIYMPMVSIVDIQFYIIDPDTQSLAFRLLYSIPNIGVKDLLEFTI